MSNKSSTHCVARSVIRCYDESLKKVKVWCEIRGTAGDRGDVNVKNVNGDIVEGGCNREVFSDGVIREEGVWGEPDECCW